MPPSGSRRQPGEFALSAQTGPAVRFPLADSRSIDGITVGRDVLDLQRNDIAGAELAIDCKIEHRKVARSLLRLKFASDRPDVLGPQRRPRTSKLAFVPRFSLLGDVTGVS